MSALYADEAEPSHAGVAGLSRLSSSLVTAVVILGAVSCSSADRARGYAQHIQQAATTTGDKEAEARYVGRLAAMGGAAEPGLRLLLSHPEENVQVRALDVLDRMMWPPDGPPELYAPTEPPRAFRSLGDVLLEYTESGNRLRGATLSYLMYQAPDQGAQRLVEMVQLDPVAGIRAQALGSLIDPWVRNRLSDVDCEAAALQAIRVGFVDPSPNVRAMAIRTAAALDDQSLLPGLVALLEDSTPVEHTGAIPSYVIWEEGHGTTDRPGEDFRPRINELAAWAIQEMSWKDYGFRTCYHSRDEMPAIAKAIREDREER